MNLMVWGAKKLGTLCDLSCGGGGVAKDLLQIPGLELLVIHQRITGMSWASPGGELVGFD